MNNPEYIKIDDKKYKINTDYRYALKCQKIAEDNTIDNYEKVIGIVYTLFKIEEDINTLDLERLLKSALKYLQGRPTKNGKVESTNQQKDMDYEQDYGLIYASMLQQYGIDINEEKIHWWKFFDLLNGLSSECILNKVREIRNIDLKEIKDEKIRNEYIKLKKAYKLDEHKEMTDKEKESVDMFYKLTGIERKE